ncbi:hypothetical protein CUMW_211700 [Citrus unshiu]|nr:hypothetical protein CUMW_211700 [Citrus unshiu]
MASQIEAVNDLFENAVKGRLYKVADAYENNPMIQNKKGHTALHLESALGNAALCHCLAWKNPKLVAFRNNQSETLLFLASLHRKKAAFLCLHFFNQEKDGTTSSRKHNGDNFFTLPYLENTLDYL